MDPLSKKIPHDLIATIHSTHEQLQQVKTLLGTIIDNLEQTPSSFNYLTQKWHQHSLSYKILWALLVSTPLLLLGVTIHVAALTALGFALCLFVGINIYLFENHKSQMKFNTEQLKQPIECMIDLLETIMNTLSATSLLLAKEVETLQQTNAKVSEECNNLRDEIKALNAANRCLEHDANALTELNAQMRVTINTVEQTVVEQREKLAGCQKTLDETIASYQQNQEELATKISELNEVKEALAKKVEHVQKLSEALSKTVYSFTQMTLTDEQNRTEFLDKFNQFLQHQEITIKSATQTITKSGEALAATVNDIQDSHTRLEGLLDRQEQAVIQLEKLTPDLLTSKLKAPISHGIFPVAKPIMSGEQQGHTLVPVL